MEGPLAPGLLEGLLLAAGTLEARRELLTTWCGDLAGPLLVPAPGAAALQEELAAQDHGLRVALVAAPGPGDPAGLLTLRTARNLLLDDDRAELTGVHLPLPGHAEPGRAAQELLAELDFTVPAWIEVLAEPGADRALRAIAADGAERLALRLPAGVTEGTDPAAAAHLATAALVRSAVDLDLPLRVTGSGSRAASAIEVLAVLSTVRAALNGAEGPELAAELAERRPAVLAASLRRMSGADAAAARAFVDGIVVADVAEVAAELAALGLVNGPA